ncbi:MAG: hypothetical protein M1127_01330 [Patescibacteria group bacterium]|nr:hypothetical protein [Patescibacteria group bacterium]
MLFELHNFVSGIWQKFAKAFRVSQKPFTRKKIIFAVGVSVLFCLCLPLHQAYAFAVAAILIPAAIGAGVSLAAGVLTKVASIAVMSGLILTLCYAWIAIANHLFSWAIGDPFGLSFTNPNSNLIIQIGWTVLRDLTNMFFILGLAYIGLATALNLGNFKTWKTFSRLLLIALIINFTPVICGVIVDAANIVTNFFMSQVSFDQFITTLNDNRPSIAATIFTAGLNVISSPSKMGELVLTTFVTLLAGFILIIFGLLFLMRYFVIWILVIISPLAFFASIFEQTQKHYKKWWDTFISWSFIALPAAFLLYLAQHFFRVAIDLQTKLAPAFEDSDPGRLAGLFFKLMPIIVTTAFMYAAYVFTKKINVAGSSLILGAANKVVNKVKGVPGKISGAAGSFAGGLAGGLAAGGISKGFGAIGKRYQAAKAESERTGQKNWFMKATGAVERGFAKTKEGYEKVKESKVVQGTMGLATEGAVVRHEAKRSKAVILDKLRLKRMPLEDMTTKELEALASSHPFNEEDMGRKSGAIKKLINDGNLDFLNFEEKGNAVLQEVIGFMKRQNKLDDIKGLQKTRPDLAHLFNVDVQKLAQTLLAGNFGSIKEDEQDALVAKLPEKQRKYLDENEDFKEKIIMSSKTPMNASEVAAMAEEMAKHEVGVKYANRQDNATKSNMLWAAMKKVDPKFVEEVAMGFDSNGLNRFDQISSKQNRDIVHGAIDANIQDARQTASKKLQDVTLAEEQARKDRDAATTTEKKSELSRDLEQKQREFDTAQNEVSRLEDLYTALHREYTEKNIEDTIDKASWPTITQYAEKEAKTMGEMLMKLGAIEKLAKEGKFNFSGEKAEDLIKFLKESGEKGNNILKTIETGRLDLAHIIEDKIFEEARSRGASEDGARNETITYVIEKSRPEDIMDKVGFKEVAAQNVAAAANLVLQISPRAYSKLDNWTKREVRAVLGKDAGEREKSDVFDALKKEIAKIEGAGDTAGIRRVQQVINQIYSLEEKAV